MKQKLYCKHCKFIGETNTKDAKKYICRINPPQIVVNFIYTAGQIANAVAQNQYQWPVINPNTDWCDKLEYADGTPIITENE